MDKTYESELENCDLINICKTIGKKWSLPILYSFSDETIQPYGAILKKFNKKINHTLLSKRLISFQKIKLIEKIPEKGYKLTPFGKKIIELNEEMKEAAVKEGLNVPQKCRKRKCCCSDFFENLFKKL